jgi:hypothetical protein
MNARTWGSALAKLLALTPFGGTNKGQPSILGGISRHERIETQTRDNRFAVEKDVLIC